MIKWISRSLTVLVLALSAAALVLGVKLYKQRETLKGRTQKLETAVQQVAATLEAEENNPDLKLTLPADQLKTYATVPGGPAPMDVPLNLMVNAAQRQLVRLNATRTELADTRGELARTVETLARTSNDLVSARDTIREQTATIETKNAQIAEKEASIQALETEKTALKAETESLAQEIDTIEGENRDLIYTNEFLVARVDELEKMVTPDMRKEAIPKGQLGRVAYVNREWNFLLVRMAPDRSQNVMPDLELLVHRGQQLVGKVRVQTVVDQQLAVAEIINDWQRVPFGPGDDVMY